MLKSQTLVFTCVSSLVIVFLFPLYSFAGAFFKDSDEFFLKYLKESKFDIGNDAPAIVLYEKNTTDIIENNRVFFRRVHIRKIIRILNNEGLSYADISAQLYAHGFDVSRIHGTTYNLEQGKLKKQDLDRKSVSNKIVGDIVDLKFSMPSVFVGSIIDYSYTVEAPLSLLVSSWDFQSGIPKLYSEMELSSLALFDYKFITYGNLFFLNVDDRKKNIDESVLPNACVYPEDFVGDKMIKRWVRKNVAALSEEPFISNISNHTERLDIIISGFKTPAYSKGILNTWDNVNASLLEDFNFYKPLTKEHETILAKTRSLLKDINTSAEKAKAIYDFVRNNFQSYGDSRIWITSDLESIFEKKMGTPSEINLLLVVMLRYAKLDCSPVILSTVDNGKVTDLYPLLDKFNYTICELKLPDEIIYLDASGRCNPFGILSRKCYNGYCRVISEKPGSTVLEPSTLKERAMVIATTEKADIKDYRLKFSCTFGIQKSGSLRQEWSKDTVKAKAYITELLKKDVSTVQLLSVKIENLADVNEPLRMEFIVKLTWDAAASDIYLTPAFLSYYSENPFKATKRSLPIEMPFGVDYVYNLQLQLPKGYKVQDLPKSALIKIDDKDQYKYLIEYDNDQLRISTRLQMLRTNFEVDEYDALRELFEKMIREQQKVVLIKKV